MQLPGEDDLSEIINYGELEDPDAAKRREHFFREFIEGYRARARVAFEAHLKRRRGRPAHTEPSEPIQGYSQEQLIFLKGADVLFRQGETLVPKQSAADTAWVTAQHANAKGGARVLEIGSGSGVWGVAFMNASPSSRYVGIDIDPAAIRRTRMNFAKNSVDPSRFRVEHGNVLEPLDLDEFFDIVYSNPPYYTKEAEAVKEEGVGPSIATYGGSDGLRIYRAVLQQTPKLLENRTGELRFRIPFNLLLPVGLEARRQLDPSNHWVTCSTMPASFYRGEGKQTLPSGLTFTINSAHANP